MKHWKNWLPPILTSLVVLALALLPQRLSALRDKTLTGAIRNWPGVCNCWLSMWIFQTPLPLLDRIRQTAYWRKIQSGHKRN